MAVPDPPARGEQGWLLPVAGTPRSGPVADVVFDVHTRRIYACAVPAHLAAIVAPGVRVSVAYGRAQRPVRGWCLRVTQRPFDHTLTPLLAAEPGPAWLSAALADLACWVADYYAAPPARVLRHMRPAALASPPQVRMLRRTDAPPQGRISERQRKLLDLLTNGPCPRRVALIESATSSATLRRLMRRGWIEEFRAPDVPTRAPSEPSAVQASPEDDYALSSGQTEAVERVRGALRSGFSVHLLFGAPATGKTEVYVRAIRAALAAERQALLLVPEIALATQVVQRLARRFPRVAVLHSGMSGAARRDAFLRVLHGDADVVIGTRTAVFAPLERLGLIVVDEEQEGSYKSLSAPFYHARDVAIKRAQLERIPVLLGSATPALETWHNAAHLAHWNLLRLRERVRAGTPPRVEVLHWPRDAERDGAVLAPELLAALREVLAAGQQALLLHNRRGYATGLRCSRCGLTLRCARCSSRLVLHRGMNLLRCHRCGSAQPAIRNCPDDTCAAPLELAGSAIEKLESELRTTLPAARLQRLDRDRRGTREGLAEVLATFEHGAADVLLGTQMIAKGLDFPRVRLIGVVDADAVLHLPDLRARERLYQLLVQVVGRAGRRGGESRALLQCAEPQTPLLSQACALDYEAFARDELAIRAELNDPPLSRLARIVFADERAGRARDAAGSAALQLARVASTISPALHVSDAQPCVVSRQRGMQRWQVLIRAPRDGSLQRLLRDRAAERALRGGARTTLDVDPLDLL